ncbi:N-6 DNA Methylase [Paenibacillaceae bacterium GAS479]|nr:N-6 DNA Methylase [Paenibacillaceae bacterium GAS479]
MNKTALKNFATNARKELIEKVKARAFRIGITEESIKKAQFESSDSIYIDGKQLSATEKKQREKLISRIKEIGYKQLVEEVAYTWFNRFTALRFMEVNNYLPTKVRVLSSSNPDSSEPDIIKEALSVELDIDKELVYELKLSNKTEELFKYLVIKQCNSLNKVLPFMFETIDDYKEILFPEGLLVRESFLREMTDTQVIPEADWEHVEIIGWLYQYYIAEEKDRVFKAKTKYTSEEIPYATQLFTSDWIVRYLVQNSLGRYWFEAHPEHRDLLEKWELYLDSEDTKNDLEESLKPYIDKELKVENIKCFDPAMGSGHILIYMFDLLYEVYSKCGYMERDIPRLIIENNLYGLDIDNRAYQLASFSVVMKALEYNNRFLRSIERDGLVLNLTAIQETNILTDEDIAYIAGVDNGENYINTKKFVEQYRDAKTIGSLLKIKFKCTEFLQNRLNDIQSLPVADLFHVEKRERTLSLLPKLLKQTDIMSNQFDILVTNPPYMGTGSMNTILSNYLKKHYPDSKTDLFASFMEIDHYLKEASFYASINQHSWMFLSSFEKLREKIIKNKLIENMLHLGPRAFEEIGGEVVQSTAFVLRNTYKKNINSVYLRLVDEKTAKLKKEKAIEATQNKKVPYRYLLEQEKFNKIPGSPIAYWATDSVRDIFFNYPKLQDVSEPRQGMATTDNNKYLRMWYEIGISKIGFNIENRRDAKESELRWFPINKGGSFRKWYGNNEFIVDYKNDGAELIDLVRTKYPKISDPEFVIKNRGCYFKEGITWSAISSSNLAVRFSPKGFIFSNAGMMLFSDDKLKTLYILGIMNSKLTALFSQQLSSTINFDQGIIAKLPYKENNDKVVNEKLGFLVEQAINISKMDWDYFEISWDFKQHPLLMYKGNAMRMEDSFRIWNHHTEIQFNQLKDNEEEQNRIFINLYNLQSELTHEVEEKDITIRKADLERDIKSFISYAIGCSFGRYSIDENGLIYAGGEFELSHYATFKANKDNILPIFQETYFEDDIVSRFVEFVCITFGEEALTDNLEFIAFSIGSKNGETAKETLRRYFLNDFYKDHLQTYKKRPIYWLFTSGKQKAFNCLIYMHRYDKSTLSRIRTDYLHELQIRLDVEKKSLLDIINGDATTKEISNAKKELKSLDLKIEELRAYDEKLHHMADMQIEIDLDDGVTVNYAKFEGLLAPIK